MIKDLSARLHLIPRGLMVSAVFLAAFLFWRENRGRSAKKLWDLIKNETWVALFLIYSALLFTGTILARQYAKHAGSVVGVFGLLSSGGKLNSDGVENLLMFIPYTFLWLMAFRPVKPVLKCLLLSFGTTLFIETSQLLFSLGEFSLADIAHNILGGMLGCGIWYGIRVMRDKKLIIRLWKRFRHIQD